MRKQLDFLALILYCLFIFWLSDQSTLPTPDLFENEDKLHHFLAYYVMGVFAWRAFSHWPYRRELVFLASFCFCSLYGASETSGSNLLSLAETPARWIGWPTVLAASWWRLPVTGMSEKRLKSRKIEGLHETLTYSTKLIPSSF